MLPTKQRVPAIDVMVQLSLVVRGTDLAQYTIPTQTAPRAKGHIQRRAQAVASNHAHATL